MDKLASFREKHPKFLYESFSYKIEDNSLVISFLFKIYPDIEFNPRVTIENINQTIFSNLDSKVLDNFVFNLGLVEMISYWKATCSPIIEIYAGTLKQNQLIWWKSLLIKGLGEFFYQNNINFKENDFVNITCTSQRSYKKDNTKHKNRYIIMNSGGRDSVVSLELFKDLKKAVTLLMLNPTKASLDVAKISALGEQIVIDREIDKKLLELNAKGYLNGHTPFSAYLAFVSVLCALIFDYKFIVSSNERSANEENVEFQGEKINHQYSKSFEFEKSFREYVNENLSDDIDYFSLLRPLYEIQISKLFSNYPKYFNSFKSCNRGQADNVWCGKCPKCLSIYVSLHPFIDEQKIVEIFSEDLYAKSDLQDLLLQITGKKQPKPFECVGTYIEIQLGLALSVEKFRTDNKPLPPILKYSQENILNHFSKQSGLLKSWDENNFLPNDMAETLKAKIEK
ncbi:hypothetical protein A2870_03230 [Candidatus Curtissbacteria bacterium RIFCSPHIGHO2_01_FULL_41_11]|uniref:UDP-N-acetyl-alpha-D-muramoyl-L-alanyl-L-glutamate epimerase n=1 Tax=Candidatus Curtissbacteria bacterium RIFCSPHIGHO2_01_FULL_41_11 TaxID=1797711 RepID=A0A1F5G4U8_9BACT|nr:MAG: hypothetical protein A2870_03230 [Candidatus Curtissbacteria bacterium RIFCSPHIGHO2_01_FULL_41_11]